MRQPPISSNESAKDPEHGTYQISASLYSIPLRHSVVLVTMIYQGADIDAALNSFADRVRATIPTVTCAGWNYNTPVNANQLREMLERL